ncbi:MAG TPA: trigger factor [Candidatus Paceibacterota bacterium]
MSYKVEVKKLPKSEMELKGSIEAPLLEGARKKALKKLSERINIAGFRKGHVPEKVVVEKIGEGNILEEAAEILLSEFYPKILVDQKIDSIGRPKVSITKLATHNPLEFTITTAVLPIFELGDYKKVTKDIREKEKSKEVKIEATEKEINDVVTQIRKNKAHYDWSHSASPFSRATRDKQDNLVHDHPDFEKEENLPEFNDEFAKQVGKFESVEQMKEKVKENIIEEKKYREIEKKRALIMDALVKTVDMELPDILIESEVEKSLAQMKDDVARAGANFEDYLKETKKKEEDLRADLREGANKKAKIQLIFNKIAEEEKLAPNKEILEHEVKQILEHYPGASEESARIYIATQLLNREVLKLLEQ